MAPTRCLGLALALGLGAPRAGARKEDPECGRWAEQGECASNPRTMLVGCRHACSSEARKLPDAQHNCWEWAGEHECTKNREWMNLHCAAACGHQWLWAPPTRVALGLAAQPERRPEGLMPVPPAVLLDDGSVRVDGLVAALDRAMDLEALVVLGEKPAGMVLADDDRSLVLGVCSHLLLYAARLGRVVAARAALSADAFLEVERRALAALADDPERRDWALRELPNWTRTLRKALDALVEEGADGAFDIAPAKRHADATVAALGTIPLKGSGVSLPVVGVGTCWLNEAQTEEAVFAAARYALDHPDLPRVHIDSAENYRNEAAVGRALGAAGPGARARVFLASKISERESLSAEGARRRVRETLDNFGVKRVDLYSLHSLFGLGFGNEEVVEDMRGAWQALVELQDEGVIGALGLSNADAADLRAFAADEGLGGLRMPDVVQNKLDAYRRGSQQAAGGEDVLAVCAELGLAVVGYSALSGWPYGVGALGDPLLRQLAARRGEDVAALVNRWVVDSGRAGIPRSSRAEHVVANLMVLDSPPLLPAELGVFDAIPHLVAFDLNRARTPDVLGVWAEEDDSEL